jgi:hypothetical protein
MTNISIDRDSETNERLVSIRYYPDDDLTEVKEILEMLFWRNDLIRPSQKYETEFKPESQY